MKQQEFLIRVAFRRLGERLSRTLVREMTNDDVFDWLLAGGFSPTRGGWLATARSLSLLEGPEVVEAFPLD